MASKDSSSQRETETGLWCPKCLDTEVEDLGLPFDTFLLAILVGTGALFVSGGWRLCSPTHSAFTLADAISLLFGFLAFGGILAAGSRFGATKACKACGLRFSTREATRPRRLAGQPAGLVAPDNLYEVKREVNRVLGFAVVGAFIPFLTFFIQPWVLHRARALTKRFGEAEASTRTAVRLRVAKWSAIASMTAWGVFILASIVRAVGR